MIDVKDFIQIEKVNEEFEGIIESFGKIYPDKLCCIGGGAVRDFLLGRMPKDIDVFFMGADWTTDAREDFEKRLQATGLSYRVDIGALPWHKYERYLLLSILWNKQQSNEGGDLSIQFMGFPWNNITDLLRTFDWEICLFGYQRGGRIITTQRALDLIEGIKKYSLADPLSNAKYIPPKMRLCNVQFPISNLRRGFKFEARYPIKLEYESIIKLCSEVLREDADCRIRNAREKKEAK